MRHSKSLELMDQPGLVSREEMVGALRGLRRVNRVLGGRRALLSALGPMLIAAHGEKNRPIRICDIGTGAGDLPIVMARYARRRKIPIRVTAVEMNADLAASARAACQHYPEINVVCADARSILRATGRGVSLSDTAAAAHATEPFDIVTASLFLHHFLPQEVTGWISLMNTAARFGWIVNDLERHPLAYAGIRIVGRFISSNRVFLNDAPLSVRRAYTPAEWLQLARKASVEDVTLRRRWPWRITMASR